MKITSSGVASNLWKNVFKDVGIPEKIISDRGPQFVSNFMKELCRLLKIERNPSTAYHPQTDGQTERTNQEVEQYLRSYVNYRQTNWASWLPMAEFSYNNRIHSATGYSPFYLNYGRHPNTEGEIELSGKVPAVDKFVEELEKVRKDAGKSLEEANKKMKEQYDRKKKEARKYKKGELVWVDGSNISTDQPTKKLSQKRYGPFPIVKEVGNGAYEVKIPTQWKRVHNVFNEVKLTPYKASSFDQQSENSENRIPETKGEEPLMEVEKILDSRWNKEVLQYKVKWRGQPIEESSWEDRGNVFEGAAEKCREFHKENPEAPRMPVIRIPPQLRGRIGLRRG
jgi:hypothetical protein